MALSITQLFLPTVLTTAALPLFTMPTSPGSSILKNGRMRFTNTTGGPVTVTAYAVPKAGSAGVGNEFVSSQSIPANSFLDTDVPVLAEGDILEALASANASITATILDGVIFS